MAGGWGKRAVGKIDRTQYGHDELLKSLSGQFNVDFSDYEKWKRTDKSKHRPKLQAASSILLGLQPERGFTVGKGGAPVCQHKTIKGKKEAARHEEEEKQRAERIKILELRLHTRKKTLQEYKKRQKELLVENIKLQQEINGVEKDTHGEVKGLLRKYEKFQGGISTLNNNFEKELKTAKEDYDTTDSGIKVQLAILEQHLASVDKELKERQGELHILINYKDKEYPVKAMKIADLQKEIEDIKLLNMEDCEELEHIIASELAKYQREQIKVANDITQQVIEKAISVLHPSQRDMALQNMVMKKELEYHQKEQEELTKANQELKTSIRQLLRDPKTNIRLQMFPEFFPTREKCTQDMEVVLDIPTQKWLPI